MTTPCSHCTQLIKSEIVSEPHSQLETVISRDGVSIYQCQLCSTLFEFTSNDIYLISGDDGCDENEARAI